MLSPQPSQTFRRQDAVSSGAEEPHADPAAGRTVGEYEKVFAWRLLASLSGAGCSCSVLCHSLFSVATPVVQSCGAGVGHAEPQICQR